MSLRDVLYSLYDIMVLILSSLSFIKKNHFELRNQQNPQSSTVSILEFEMHGRCIMRIYITYFLQVCWFEPLFWLWEWEQ